MWRFPFINTGCLNATYYKILSYYYHVVAGLAPARPIPTWLVPSNLPLQARRYLASHPRLAHSRITHKPPTVERRPGMDWLSADSRHQGETQSNGTGLARQHEVQ